MPIANLPIATNGRGAFEVAEQAVRASGAVIMAHLPQMSLPQEQRTISVSNKGGWNNIVTDVDQAAEREIISILNIAFPQDEILAEESGSHYGTTGYSWCIDPLDGTRNFASGIPHLCVNLALSQDDKLLLALTYDPVRNELFHAIAGNGAFLNGQSISISEQTKLQECIVGTDMGYKADEGKMLLAMLEKLWPNVQSVRMMGSAALGLAYAAAGRIEMYVHHYVQPWDIAAGLLLIREAGGIATDLRGSFAYPASGCVVAASPRVHAAFMEATKGGAWRSA